MKKLMVAAIFVICATVSFAAYYSGGSWSESSPVTFEGTITVYVYQWLDAAMLWNEEWTRVVEVKDYSTENIEKWYYNTVGTLYIRSNAKVFMEATVTYLDQGTDPRELGLTVRIIPNNQPLEAWADPSENQSYQNYKGHYIRVEAKASASTPAGRYRYLLTISLKPTVTFSN